MAKKEKYYFGIFEDGINLKVAQLKINKNDVQLMRLEQTQMEKSIYAEESKKKKKKKEGDFADRIAAGEKITFDDLKGLDVTQQDKGSLDSIVSPHENLLSKFALNFGQIALNANEKKITKKVVNEKISSLSYRKLNKLKIITKDEKKDKSITYGIIPLPNEATEIVIHRGDNKLFHYLEKFNQSQYKTKFYYSLVDPNDISLINSVRLHYDFAEDQITFLLYLGLEYQQVLVFQGNDFLKSIPFVIPGNFIEIKEVVRSKMMLLLDEGELPQPNRIILAGEHSKSGDVNYFQEYYPTISVEQFSCKNLIVDENADFDSNQIAEYIIPISLAWKAAKSKDNKLLQTNFLNKTVLERQKMFRIGWHGFLIIALIFGFSFVSTKNILSIQETVQTNMQKIANLRSTLTENEIFTQENESIYQEIEALKNSEKKIRSILHNQNKSSFIIHQIAAAFQDNPISWMKEFSIKEELVQFDGTTTEIENVIEFSYLFPDGKINFVKQEEIAETQVWNFEIHFPYQTIDAYEHISEQTSPKADNDKALYNEIVSLYTKKDWQKALEKMELFETNLPESVLLPNVYYLRGEILFWLKNYARAEKNLQRALAKGSNLKPFAYFMLARTLQQRNETANAFDYLNLLKKEFPNHSLLESAENLSQKWEVNHE